MISGYIGPRPAAKVLLEMCRRQEAIFGGFYSGLATVSDDQLHWHKVAGCADHLASEIRLDDYPGNIGIAHSRNDLGGGAARAQPYVDNNNTIASVANGIVGVFEEENRKRSEALAQQLSNDGCHFDSAVPVSTSNDIHLPNGSTAHIGEVIAQGLSLELRQGKEFLETARDMFLEMPAEVVNVFLSVQQPESISLWNCNQSLMIGQNDSEIFIATSSLGFLDQVDWSFEIPANSLARVGLDGVEVRPLLGKSKAQLVLERQSNIENAIIEFVKSSPGKTWLEIIESAVEPIFPARKLVSMWATCYRTLERLLVERRIRYEVIDATGKDEQGPIPQAVFYVE